MQYPNNPNELDWGSMSKAEFKRAELHYELRGEQDTRSEYYVLFINDKRWKEFYTLKSANQAAVTIRAKHGKKVDIRKYMR